MNTPPPMEKTKQGGKIKSLFNCHHDLRSFNYLIFSLDNFINLKKLHVK